MKFDTEYPSRERIVRLLKAAAETGYYTGILSSNPARAYFQRCTYAKAKATHCVRGHEFTRSNTYIAKNGTRHCKACSRLHDKGRGRDAAYWRAYRKKNRG